MVVAGLLVSALSACRQAASPAHEITLLAFQTGGFREHYIRTVVEPFERAHPDVKVTFYGVRNSAAELGVLRAHGADPSTPPPADVTIIDLSVARIARDEGLLDEVRRERVPNGANLHPVGAELGWYGLPVTYDTLALVYDTQAIQTPPTSWNELWNPAHKGRVVIPAEGGGDIQAIAFTIIANRLAGNDDYARDLGPGVERLVALAPAVQTWEPKPDLYTLVANGTASIAIGWNARSQLHAIESKGRLGTVTPREGTISQVDVISLVKGARERDAAEAFIDYALGVEAQARFSQAMFYAPTNRGVQVDDDTRSRIPLLDEGERRRLVAVDWLAVADMRERILEPWRRTIIPASR